MAPESMEAQPQTTDQYLVVWHVGNVRHSATVEATSDLQAKGIVGSPDDAQVMLERDALQAIRDGKDIFPPLGEDTSTPVAEQRTDTTQSFVPETPVTVEQAPTPIQSEPTE